MKYIRAKILIMDQDELALVVTALYAGDVVKISYSLLLKVQGKSFDIDDFVVHKHDKGPAWKGVTGCAFLDFMGVLKKQGMLIDIEEVEDEK
jgi:hypothetical protein